MVILERHRIGRLRDYAEFVGTARIPPPEVGLILSFSCFRIELRMIMFRVLVTDNLSQVGVKVLEEAEGIEVDVRPTPSPEELREVLKDVDGIIIRSATKLTAEVLEGQPRLKAIARAGVGVDNIDRVAATREGIVVMNTPGGNTTSTAEHAFAMMLALSRNIAPAAASMKEGKWDRKKFTGSQLAGKTLAVIGLGRIGVSVAQRAMGFEMRVIGYDPFMSPEKAAEHGIEFFHDVDELVTQCDYLSVHTPLTDETRGIINAERISKMKKGARLVNCARGGVLDEDAVADAVESGHLAGAAFDVFNPEPPAEDHRLRGIPGILLTPHLGASTEEAQELVALEAAEIMSGYLLRNEVRHAINMAPISGAEMEDMRTYLDLAHRLGLLLAQQSKATAVKSATVHYRGEAANKKTKLITSSFAAGLLGSALEEDVNIVNAETLAHERGIEITEATSVETGDFSTVVSATIQTDAGELSAAGTIFGHQFLRLVKLGPYQLDSYLDGQLLIYRHRDVPGLIGFIGTVFGKHNVNIAHMALGRETSEPGGDAVAVLNLDSQPSEAALAEISEHAEVLGVELVQLPAAGDTFIQ
jgi:D-3-phosphoglycerate dehydrogenase / 2-oxoglutarate reductase